jgi:hypothetical protein
MAVFYLLPPRSLLGDHCAELLQRFLPGLDWDAATRMQLVEALTAAAADGRDVYVIHREDLPPGEPPGRALIEAFGAQAGDEVVEVRPQSHAGELSACRWRVA